MTWTCQLPLILNVRSTWVRANRNQEKNQEGEVEAEEEGGDRKVELTDPMDMKNPNVAAEESIYCESVATTPLGPGPALRHVSARSLHFQEIG
jgi:hypothetical protein